MKNWTRVFLFLMVVGPLTIPAWAAELRVTGFFDNTFPRWDSNHSSVDGDTTRNGDNLFAGRSRSRFFFNFIASDDLRGIFALEIDLAYGAPSFNRLGSGCVEGTGTFASEQCGFRNGIDVNALELKHLYVDFRVPQLPLGNRWRIGGRSLNITPLHSLLLYQMDNGGGDVTFTLTDQVSLLLYYTQLEEDLDRFVGSAKIGEDYLAGTTIMLKPIDGLDFHIPFAYYHGQRPFGGSLLGTGGPFNGIAGDSFNVTTEDRYYIGFDARYRIGNTRIEPGFIYLFGTRNFTAASAAATGVNDTDFDAFQAHIVVQHTTGPWLFAGKFGYVSGDDANADLNNRGVGNRSDVKGFRYIGVDTSHFFGEWFEILGKSDVDGVFDRDFRRMGEASKLDRFGWMILGGKAEYKATDKLVLEGAVGGFWTAEKTACPASIRTATGECGFGAPGSATSTGTNPRNSSGESALNFTGNSKFVGWEIDLGLRYTIMPGLVWTPRVGFADYGDATSANGRSAKEAWVITNRMIYIF
ncbi:MAG TPA: hypothetical protein VNP04_27935 [Alphaproteobacteria bacterium]|nr:hypothetical protein [Alphaproteobacteria bacterium]